MLVPNVIPPRPAVSDSTSPILALSSAMASPAVSVASPSSVVAKLPLIDPMVAVMLVSKSLLVVPKRISPPVENSEIDAPSALPKSMSSAVPMLMAPVAVMLLPPGRVPLLPLGWFRLLAVIATMSAELRLPSVTVPCALSKIAAPRDGLRGSTWSLVVVMLPTRMAPSALISVAAPVVTVPMSASPACARTVRPVLISAVSSVIVPPTRLA